MQLLIGCDGAVRCIYNEAIDLRTLGRLSIQRASYVEPDERGELDRGSFAELWSCPWTISLPECGTRSRTYFGLLPTG